MARAAVPRLTWRAAPTQALAPGWGCFHFSKNKSVLSSLAHQGYAEPRAHRPSHSAQTVRVQQRTESGSGLL